MSVVEMNEVAFFLKDTKENLTRWLNVYCFQKASSIETDNGTHKVMRVQAVYRIDTPLKYLTGPLDPDELEQNWNQLSIDTHFVDSDGNEDWPRGFLVFDLLKVGDRLKLTVSSKQEMTPEVSKYLQALLKAMVKDYGEAFQWSQSTDEAVLSHTPPNPQTAGWKAAFDWYYAKIEAERMSLSEFAELLGYSKRHVQRKKKEYDANMS